MSRFVQPTCQNSNIFNLLLNHVKQIKYAKFSHLINWNQRFVFWHFVLKTTFIKSCRWISSVDWQCVLLLLAGNFDRSYWWIRPVDIDFRLWRPVEETLLLKQVLRRPHISPTRWACVFGRRVSLHVTECLVPNLPQTMLIRTHGGEPWAGGDGGFHLSTTSCTTHQPLLLDPRHHWPLK